MKPACIVNQNDPNTIIRRNAYMYTVVIAAVFDDSLTVLHYNNILFVQGASTDRLSVKPSLRNAKNAMALRVYNFNNIIIQ